MTRTYRCTGADPLLTPPMTDWQRERIHGRIIPMPIERPSLWRRICGRSK